MKLALFWSGGKDSAWALHRLRNQPGHSVVTLVTTMVDGHVPIQNIPADLIECQAQAADIPLARIELPQDCPNPIYRRTVLAGLETAHHSLPFEAVAFADLFLQDIREWREDMFRASPWQTIFPLWGEETAGLSRLMVDAGLCAVLTCVNGQTLDSSFAGRLFDDRFLDQLPQTVDACGENGEFHTFCFDGPMFSKTVSWKMLGQEQKGQFTYQHIAVPCNSRSQD